MLAMLLLTVHTQIGPNSTAAAARKTGVSYKDAGVDIDAGNALVEVCVYCMHIYIHLEYAHAACVRYHAYCILLLYYCAYAKQSGEQPCNACVYDTTRLCSPRRTATLVRNSAFSLE
jgi:hypothetical protein